MRSSRPWRALLGWAACLFVAAAAVVAAGLGDARAQTGPSAGDAVRGEELYTANCSWCHSPDGRGGIVPATGDPAPPVNDVSISYVRLTLVTGRMPPGADPFDSRHRGETLPPEDQDDILAFMVERFGLTGDVEAPPPGDAARGLEVYAQHCAQCHGATGEGGVAGAGAYTPRILGYSAQTLADAIRVGPFQMPRFDSEQISDEEIGDLAAFLSEVDEEPGALLWPGELHPVYASAFVLGLMVVLFAVTLVITGRPVLFPDPETPASEEDV